MGLPLFVAPVESDVPLQARRKVGSTSPRRSSIRRLGYYSRPRETVPSTQRNPPPLTRPERRRARTLEYALSTEPPHSSGRSSAAEYVRNGFLSPEDLTNSELRENPHRQSMVRNMIVLFGQEWQQRDWERPQEDINGSWWVVQTPGPGGRPRLLRLDGRALDSPSSSTRGSPDRDYVQLTWANRPTLQRSPGPTPWSEDDFDRRADYQGTPTHPLEQVEVRVNGLGDRERSLSPEVWDTLLTTLTPDPQPPSASSSFVSNTGTQVPAQPTATTQRPMNRSLPRPGSAHAPESAWACESGGENSGDEDFLQEFHQRYDRPFLDAARVRGVRPPIPDRARESRPLSALDIMTMLPSLQRQPRRRYSSRRPNPVRFHVPERSDESHEPRDGSRSGTTPRATSSGPQDRPPQGRDRSENTNVLRFEAPDSRNGWVGQLVIDSMGTQAPTEPRLGTSHNASSTEEGEIADLRRIVRNLAELQDIPDELWASAGIGRTLHREANN